MIPVPVDHIRFCSQDEIDKGVPYQLIEEGGGLMTSYSITISDELQDWLASIGAQPYDFDYKLDSNLVRTYYIESDLPGLDVLFKLRWAGQ